MQEKHAQSQACCALKQGGMTTEAKGAKIANTDTKHMAKHAVWLANYEPEKEEFTTVSPSDGVFRIAKQMDHTNQAIVGENSVRNDAGELVLNVPNVSVTLIHKARSKLKCCKEAAGPSDIVPQMLKADDDEGIELARQLTEAGFSCSVVSSDWEESFILYLHEGKGEALDHGNYHGLEYTTHTKKLLQ